MGERSGQAGRIGRRLLGAGYVLFRWRTAGKTAASARSFLKSVHEACPLKIVKLLTDNGREFTDRLFASRERQATGEHEFDRLCAEFGIEHRLTKPGTPKTNGMVERFNGRIGDVLKTHRFHSGEDLAQTLLRYVSLYNHQFPQSALKSKTPMQAMKDWCASHPHLFGKRPYDRPGCDNLSKPVIAAAIACVREVTTQHRKAKPSTLDKRRCVLLWSGFYAPLNLDRRRFKV